MEAETPNNNSSCVQNANEVDSNSNPTAPPLDFQTTCSAPCPVPSDSQPTYPPPPYGMPPSSGVPYAQPYPQPYPQPYAQPYAAPPYALSGYTPLQPGFASPSYTAPYYPPSQQQQQQVVVVNGQQQSQVIVAQRPIVSMVGAIVFSCFVFWLCFMLFGGIAFILAVVGQSSLSANDTQKALSLRNASLGVSSAGLAIGAVIIILIIFV